MPDTPPPWDDEGRLFFFRGRGADAAADLGDVSNRDTARSNRIARLLSCKCQRKGAEEKAHDRESVSEMPGSNGLYCSCEE